MKAIGGTALTLAMSILIALASAISSPITIQTVTRVMNFTQNYSMEYFTHNKDNKPQVRFTLRLINYDITSWTSTQGYYGIWLGVGFGR